MFGFFSVIYLFVFKPLGDGIYLAPIPALLLMILFLLPLTLLADGYHDIPP